MEEYKEITPELKEAARKFAHRDFAYNADPCEEIMLYTVERDAFIAGALWQKEQTKNERR